MEIKDGNLKRDLKEYLEMNDELNKIIDCIREFKEVIFSKKVRRLSYWIKKAKKLT